MVYNGKPCKRCLNPMIMHSKYQTLCNSCKDDSGIGRKDKLKKYNEERKRK